MSGGESARSEHLAGGSRWMMREMETLRKFGKMLGAEWWLPDGETTSGRLHRTPSKMFLFPLQNTELQMQTHTYIWKECQIRYWSVESMSIISMGHESHGF